MRVHGAEGEQDILARAVIDASGTIEKPGALGASGLPALGERAAARRIFYGIPDVLGAERRRYAGRRVLVVGSGHSALNALLDLRNSPRGAGHANHVGHSPSVARPICSEARGRTSSRSAASSARASAACSTRAASSSSPDSRSIGSSSTADGVVVERRGAGAPAGRRNHRGDRVQARLVDALGGAPGSRSGGREPARPRAAHRPERPQLRHRAAARRRGTEAAGRRTCSSSA